MPLNEVSLSDTLEQGFVTAGLRDGCLFQRCQSQAQHDILHALHFSKGVQNDALLHSGFSEEATDRFFT